MTEVGFCAMCSRIRQDDAYGPVTPCACFVKHHADGCRLKIVVLSPIAIPCDIHNEEECLTCFPCTCGVSPAEMFMIDGSAFTWEPNVGLVPVMPGKSA